MIRQWYIYSLSDPRDGSVRYIGWTYTPLLRLRTHIKQCKGTNTHKGHWIASLVKIGLRPVLCVIESGEGDGWAERERRWIARYRAQGARLTNATDGGDGTPGLIPDAATRAKMSAAHVGRPVTTETRLRLSEALRGKPKSAEHCAKMSAMRRGKVPTGLTEAAAAKVRGTRQSAEHVARRMANRDHRNLSQRKLTDDAVRVIRAGGESQRALGARFGLAVASVHAIQKRLRYRDVPDDPVLGDPHCLPIEQQRSLFT